MQRPIEFKDYAELDHIIARDWATGAFSEHDQRVFVPHIQKLKPGDIYLEVGVDCGKSLAVAYLTSVPGVKIYGVDIVDKPERQELFKKLGKDAVFIHEDSQETAKTWDNGKISLLLIDGNHYYEPVKADINSWYPHMKPGGQIFFHDFCESSPGVIQAVGEAAFTPMCKHFEIMHDYRLRTSLARIVT